jgi:hypothetical protein
MADNVTFARSPRNNGMRDEGRGGRKRRRKRSQQHGKRQA